MESLGEGMREYRTQLEKGHIQRAYRGIMAFMSELKARLESLYPDYISSALYPGYMDMTYFAFTPPTLRDRRLKIAIVYLHEEGGFEAWLAGNNRKTQRETVEMLLHRDIGDYALSKIQTGVDSIIAMTIVKRPDFDNPDELKREIVMKALEFAGDMCTLVTGSKA